ncbi:MAG TPA: hypothetical protein VGB18_04380 [Candidatus Thermoplasmatota archaeon]
MVLRQTPNRDRVNVVRAHRFDTTAYVVANQPNCLRLAKTESEKLTGRRLRLLGPAELAQVTPVGSWCAAIIVCPGDGLETVASWASRLEAKDRGRVWFYLSAGLDPARLLKPWHDAGLGDPLWTGFQDFLDFNQVFANDLTEQIFQDHQHG